jgi:3'-phosphoadenosine 5'-phosphosulfate sulfotransferase (PAPS reductase)/FAD synthetase
VGDDFRPDTSTLLPFNKYDYVIISFSGGKDSLACLLNALDMGIPREKIELWHQAVDGRPGVDPRFFDWPCTESYCRQVANALGIPLRFQWRERGMMGEILKGSPQPGLPFTLHTTEWTAYFRVDQSGKVWSTKLYENATKFATADEAQAVRLQLPQEDALVPKFFSPDELRKKQDALAEDMRQAVTDIERRKVRERLQKLTEPAVMPPLDLVNITTPTPSYPVGFELRQGGLASGAFGQGGGEGGPGVRLQFPAAVANLRTRWCSAHLKIDVAQVAINNDPKYDRATVLEITGERRQESENRSHYSTVDRHKSTTKKRRVDQWRAILEWPEERVWEIIQRWGVRPHPAYYLGFGRVSCLPCIFSNPDQWASIAAMDPALFSRILGYEHQFGRTIQAGGDIAQHAGKGVSHALDPAMIALAMNEHLPPDYAMLRKGEPWMMPSGAFKKSGGPL